ncbi:MAG: diguanylate cyclase [Lactobacillus equicursoris]|uniref:diguanylate cyclase domain-containing protein n=1 Tax=Lactobacillus equicursoris TaxID=420645 RepID=UPI00242C12F3|nr:diguanylate cyclase [Lactobacillus equicursoris]MDD6407547.1 diguanylate cyclase [Lactobacillus equicursoris]
MKDKIFRLRLLLRKINNYTSTLVLAVTIFVITLAGIQTFYPEFKVENGQIRVLDQHFLALHLLITLLVSVLFFALLHFREREKEVLDAAARDSLTTLLTRSGFDDAVNRFLNGDQDQKSKAGFFLMLDIDDFKQINDVHGHDVGDQVLVTLALNMESVLGSDAIICRNGGDEFCAFLPGKDADRIKRLSSLDQVFSAKSKQYPFTVSIGYVEYPRQAQSETDALTKADLALYVVKQHDKNGFQQYHRWMKKSDRKHLGLTLREVADNLPVSFLICGMDEDKSILYANQDMISLMGCANLKDFLSYTDRKMDHVIYPTDRPKVNMIVAQAVANVNRKSQRPEIMTFRLLTKDGRPLKVLAKGRLVRDPRDGLVFYVTILDMATDLLADQAVASKD